MRAIVTVIAMVACCAGGCAGLQENRPCGPGYLGNIFIPQGCAGADFRDACAVHDDCYATPGIGRQACDEQFLHDLLCACECSHCPALCRMRAHRWYHQVRLFGGPAFWKAQHRPGGK